jgi:hypothetical protein
LKAFAEKKFLSPQEARRFHMARRPPNTSGWLCNFANVVHEDGPNGCGQPELGGYWYNGPTISVRTSGPV